MRIKSAPAFAALIAAGLLSACNGGGTTTSSNPNGTTQLSDGTVLSIPSTPLSVSHGNVTSTAISASGGKPDTLLDFTATNTTGPVVSFVQNGVTSGKTQNIQVKVDATGAAPGDYNIPLSLTTVSPTQTNSGTAKSALKVTVASNGSSSFNLAITNNSLVGVNVVAAGSINASIAAGSSQNVTLYTDTVYNLQTVTPAQVLGSLQQSSYYYNLQATPQTYDPVWENINVAYHSSANNSSGSYQTVLGSGASSPTFTSACAQDSGSIGVVCNLSAVQGSIAGSTVALTLTGGHTPAPTPSPTPSYQSASGMNVTSAANWAPQSYDVIWYPTVIYPQVIYNGTTYVACSSASATQQPGSSSWTPWVPFDFNSPTRACP